ncbi:MAG: carbohydrate kinase family protein [Candidatus Levybacteria bacterium]|nr:carbohydrate kinase family protein [Candidatus Levybacteria bacterium]
MIIVTGSLAYDYIMDFPGSFGDHILPEQIHKINLSFIVNKFAKRRGGTAGNVSYSLGLLKTQHILFSIAGKDFKDYKKEFKKFKILTDFVKIEKNKYTSTGFAMTDKNDNQIWGYFYGATDNIYRLKLKTIATEKDFVLIGPCGARGSMSFVKQCAKLGVSYMFDPGFILTEISNKDLLFGVKNAAFVVGNDYEIDLIKERVGQKEFINKIIITTLGKSGAIINEKGKVHKILPVKPKTVIDPTGAGDAWRSGFLAGWQKNFSLKTCGQMGAVAASFAIEHYGTQEHTYTIKDFINRYRQTYKTLLEL